MDHGVQCAEFIGEERADERSPHAAGRFLSLSDPMISTNHAVRIAAVVLTALCISFTGTGCLPYAMAGTANTLSPYRSATSVTMSSVRSAGSLRDSSDAIWPAYDLEYREGLDDRSDYGLRLTSFSGVVISYKRRLVGQGTNAGLAAQVEGGVVNLGTYVLGGASLVGSSSEDAPVTVFGGLRSLFVLRTSSDVKNDSPTAGGFVGAKFGSARVSLMPEVGLYYDHSVLGLRKGNLIVVPTISVRMYRRVRESAARDQCCRRSPPARPRAPTPRWPPRR